jgi:hypothetical protein
LQAESISGLAELDALRSLAGAEAEAVAAGAGGLLEGGGELPEAGDDNDVNFALDSNGAKVSTSPPKQHTTASTLAPPKT